MPIESTVPNVGDQDPELKNSPVVEAMSEEFETLAQNADEEPVCYFNNVSYNDGRYVCAGRGELLHCVRGVWVQQGSCDPDNP